MKRSIKIKLAASMVLFTALAAVSSTIAWFIPTVSVTDTGEITGTTEGAYYAYGEGTEANPFGITRPRHLYNLAWLQYLGAYNKPSENGKPYYFELGDNVDMTDWVLPPIGDENNPFYGNFNGQGFVVSNLTISNDFNDLGKHPSTLSSFTQPHILGFFGVIGNYSGASLSAYSSSANEFINTGLTGLTVKTVLQDSLIGIAAGYVDATMKNVAVDSSTLNVAYTGGSTTSYGSHTTNISDYSLVGYTTKKSSIKKAVESIYSVNVSSGYEFNATDQGDSTGWGGSIDMKSVTQRLQRIRDNLTSTSNFTYYREYEYTDNTLIAGNPVATKKYGDSNNDDTPVIINNNNQIGHFHFINETGYTERYALLGGGHWEKHNYYDSHTINDAFKITDGTRYLRVTGTTTFETNTNSANGSNFASDDSGRLYTVYDNQLIYLRNNNGTLAVTNNVANATVWEVDDSGTNRIIKNNNYSINVNSTTTLGRTTYTFALVAATVNTFNNNPYSIKSANSTNYLVNNGTSLTGSTTESKIWTFSNPSTTGTTTITTVINGTTYYLNHNASNNGLTLTQNEFTWTCDSSGTSYRMSYTANSTYYLTFRNNAWSVGTSTANSRANMTLGATTTSTTTYTSNLTKSAKNNTLSYRTFEETISGMNYSENDVTYFPLSTVNNTSDYTPADNNTAYVIGGSSLTEGATFYDDEISNVRFGYYPTSSSFASGDYTSSTGKFNRIYTITNDMARQDITNSTAFEKLDDARNNLANVMKNQTNVYGLHFMESTISMDSIMTAPYVKVNKTVHENYQLPVNSIDFHLKEFGYINFIAGSYYSTTVNNQTKRNNSFFALYQIERNPDTTINRILEVENVYEHSSGTKSYSYVYKLSDGSSSFYTKPYRVIDSDGNKEWLYDSTSEWSENQYVNSLPANYNMVFNCARIKKNNIASSTFDKHAYYFEIPMNDGEFCLGSASGGVGSYLMYLDIGANAAKTQRTIFYEKFTLTEKNYSYPVGVSLYTLPSVENISSGTTVVPIVIDADPSTLIDDSDSACVIIKPSASGTYVIDRNGADVALTRPPTANAPPNYVGENITLIHETGSATPIEPDCESSNTYTIKRMEYYDYNVNLETSMVTVITDTSTNGGAYSRTIYQYNYSSNDTTQDPISTYVYDQSLDTPIDQRANIKIYNTNNGIKIDSSAMISTSSLPISDTALSNNEILTFRLVQTGGDEYDDDTLLVAIVNTSDTSGTYYIFNQYKITLTPESGSIRITITNYVSGNTIYFGTTQVTGNNQVITIPAP